MGGWEGAIKVGGEGVILERVGKGVWGSGLFPHFN